MTLSEYFLNLRKDRQAYLESLPTRTQLGSEEANKNYLQQQKYVEQSPKNIEAHVNRLDASGLGYAKPSDILEFLKQANCRTNYETRVVTNGDFIFGFTPSHEEVGPTLTGISNAIYELNTDNIKNSGLYLDGLSGGKYVSPPAQSGMVGFSGVVEKGKPLSDKEKEALRRNRLRTYWSMQKSSGVGSHRVYKTATLNSKYRDLLNERLRGGVHAGTKYNFATGFGLSPSEYRELMTNDKIPGQEVNPNGGSIYCETNKVAYGSETKKDNIIDTGRLSFTDRGGDLEELSNYRAMSSKLNLPIVRAKAILNVSNFFCGPMRTPFYRAQYVNLGNEVTTVNTYVDVTRRDGSYFNFKFINEPNDKKIFTWKEDKKSNILGDQTRTPIRALLSRFPDFSENMYSVLIVNKDGEDVDLTNDTVSQTVDPNKPNSNYNLPMNAFLSRISSIQLKMPTLKNNSISFLSRSVPMIENSLNMGHTGSMSVRLDEGMSIIKSIYDWSSLSYRPLENNPDIISTNGLFRTSNIPEVNIVVHYELLSGFMPVADFDDPSTPLGKNLIFKQRDQNKGIYSRTFVFEKVKFLGIESSVDLEKDGGNMEVNLPFTFLRISEATFGHKTE